MGFRDYLVHCLSMLQIGFGKWLTFSQQWSLYYSLCPLACLPNHPGLDRIFSILRPSCSSRVPCFPAHRSRGVDVHYYPFSIPRGIRELASIWGSSVLWAWGSWEAFFLVLGRNFGEPACWSNSSGLQTMVLNRPHDWLMWFSHMWMAECGCDPGNLLRVWMSPV